MDVQMPDGTIVTGVPDNMTQAELLSRYQAYSASAPPPAPTQENPLYGVAANVTPSLASGIGGLMQFPGQLADLATATAPGEEAGFARNLVSFLMPIAAKSMQEAGEKFQKVGQEAKTVGLKEKERERAEKLAATEGELNKFGTAFAETITDPTLTSSFLFEQLPNAIGGGIGGLLTKAGGKLLFKNATKATLDNMGVAGAVVTGAAQQGADIGYNTYKDIYERLVEEGMKPEEANVIAAQKGRVAAGEAGALSYALSKIPGAREFEKALFKGSRSAIPQAGVQGVAKSTAKGVIGGGLSETGEEVGGVFASNIGKQEVFPETELTGGMGEAAAMALIGGPIMEGGAAAINARSQAKAAQRLKEQVAAITAAQKEAAAGLEGMKPDLTSPIVDRSKTIVDGKESIRTTREDGSVDVDGVLVVPPRSAVAEPEVQDLSAALPVSEARDVEAQLAELEGRQLPLAPPPVEAVAQPAQIAQPEIVQGELPGEPAPAPVPAPVAQPAQIAQEQNVQPTPEDIVPLDEKGKPIEKPKAAAPVAVKEEEPAVESSVTENTILQNRERSSPTSIAQMNAIANKPDYSRVSYSNSFLEGAPVVFGAQKLPEDQVGRKGAIVSAKTNRKIPVQYAVVDSDQLIASNAVDGSSIPEYVNPQFAGLKAVTNGRVAGLKEGYVRGTMGQYKQDLIADDIHGISPDVINRLKNPILVRVMPQDQVTKDIADESNTSSTLSLSATERAKNDANRIDLDGLEFREDGAISPETVRGFVAAMPQSEQQELIDKQGRPTRQAYDRLNAAIFYKAYGNDALVSLAAEAKSVDAANIINGLFQAAPQMAKLADAGDYDIRPQVVQAAETAINASRQGKKLSDVVSQQDLVSDNPVSRQVLQLFANNTRSAKRIGEGLRGIATDLQEESSKSQEPDMFGEAPERAPASKVIESSLEKDLSGQTPMFSRGEQEQQEADVKRVQTVAQDVASKWQNKPNIIVVAEMQSPDVPKAVRDYDAQQEGTSSPEGFFYKGDIYLVASQLSTDADIVRALQHEGLGHYGLRGVFGQSLTPILDRLAISRPDLVKERADAYGLDIKNQSDRRMAAEEALAKLAQTNPQLGLVKRAVAAIRTWLQTNVPGFKKLKMTDAQIIRDYITPAQDFVQRGKMKPGQQVEAIQYQDDVAFSKNFSKSPEFKKKFKNSKVVDEDGNPLVVYHGTNASEDFDAFDTKDVGAWFAQDDYLATGYTRRGDGEGGRVLPVYLNITNPLTIPEDIDLSKKVTAEEAFNRINDDNGTTFDPSDIGLSENYEATGFEFLASKDFIKLLKDSGFDGIRAYEGGYLTWNAFQPNQIKSVFNKRPTESEDIMFSKKPAQPTLPGIESKPAVETQIPKAKPAPTWKSLEEPTWKDTWAIRLFDKNLNLDQTQKEIEKTVKKIKDEMNAYRLETLSHGKIEASWNDFMTSEFSPIIKEMKANKITDEALTEYLVMRHAEEANDLIAERNPNNPAKQDKGSGISYEDRDKYFEKLDPAKQKQFESIASKVDSILQKTRNMLEQGGIITKENRETWEKMFEFYVPLRREESDYSLPSSSYRKVGAFSKSRTGSSKDVIDVLSNIAINREIAINRIEQERIRRAVYGLALTFPNPDIWMAVSPDAVKNRDVLAQELQDQFGMDGVEADSLVDYIMTEPNKEYFDKNTGRVVTRTDVQARYKDYVLPVKINGKDRFVFFNPKDPRAMQMVQSLKGLDTKQLPYLMALVAPVTRFFSSVNTQFNLIFGAWNFARDIQGAQLNLSTTAIADRKMEVLKGTFKAMPEIYKALREMSKGKSFSDKSDGSWSDFIAHGGKVGYKDQFARLTQSENLVNKELNKLDRGFAKRRAYATLNYISNINDVLENSTRLSAYRAALSKFKSEHDGEISERQLQNMKERAADIAKNLTVNFNRKGTWGATAGSLYAFFNASAQGTKRLYETLSGPNGKKIMAAGIAIGMVQAIGLAMAGFDEDEPTEFIKQKNLIFPSGDGGYIMIPMPFGFNIFPNLGRLFVESLSRLSKGKDVTDQFVNTITMLANAFNPLGGGGFAQMISPTVLDPAMAIVENRDAFGRPISREARGTSPKPGYTLSRDPSASISQFLAEFVNTVTFGNKDKRGLLSPTADQIDYLAGQVGGGVYRELSRAGKYAGSVIDGTDVPESQVPIVGKIVGNINSPQAISQRFYKNVVAMSEHEDAIKGRIKRRENVSEYMRDNPEASMWRRANALEVQISKLNATRREKIQKDAPVAEIKKIDDQKTRMMKQFNDDVKKRERQ